MMLIGGGRGGALSSEKTAVTGCTGLTWVGSTEEREWHFNLPSFEHLYLFIHMQNVCKVRYSDRRLSGRVSGVAHCYPRRCNEYIHLNVAQIGYKCVPERGVFSNAFGLYSFEDLIL